MAKITFNINSGCLRLEDESRSLVIGYANFFKRDTMHGEPDIECIRLESPDGLHIGSLYPDEIIEPKVPA